MATRSIAVPCFRNTLNGNFLYLTINTPRLTRSLIAIIVAIVFFLQKQRDFVSTKPF